SLIPSFVLVLEIISGGAIIVPALYDQSVIDPAGDQYPVFVIGHPGKDFIGFSIDQPNKGDPFFLIVLKSYYIGLQNQWAFCGKWGMWCLALLFFGFVGNQHARSGTIAINGHPFTSFLPGFQIKFPYQLFRNIIGQVYGNADGMVYPFLDGTLQSDLAQPV